MTASEQIIVPPDAARISDSLRDTGYELNTAIADIVDNSIAAGATQVDITAEMDLLGKIYIAIADNGHGMDRDLLIDAMKYGSRHRDDPSSLGKFGMGLKTASTAFAKRLVVVSRESVSASPLKAVWDLDLIATENNWALVLETPDPLEFELLDKTAPASSGTVVIWEKIDRILAGYKQPGGSHHTRAFTKLKSSLTQHLAMVFQRFLDPDDQRARTVAISINGKNIQAWDPYCVEETKNPDYEDTLQIEWSDGSTGELIIRAFILPRREEFSSEENLAKAQISNENQGIYVYRENRMIHGPDWMNMYRKEPHGSLLRVELSFGHELDEAFQVDIKKSRILLHETLHDELRDNILAPLRREAENRYRKGSAKKAQDEGTALHERSGNLIEQKRSSLTLATITDVVDAKAGTVEVQNNTGSTTLTLRIINSSGPRQMYVAVSDSVVDGALWEPSFINSTEGVTLNTRHPFYQKAYLPNKENATLVQALDFLLWSLAQAELNNTSSSSSEIFEEMRIEVSRNLKKLVADLPDPIENGSD